MTLIKSAAKMMSWLMVYAIASGSVLADKNDVDEPKSASEVAAANFTSCRRFIDKVRQLERQRPPSSSGTQQVWQTEERLEWEQQSNWLRQQRNMVEEFSWQLQSAMGEHAETAIDEDLVMLNIQYASLKNQLEQAGKSYRTRFESPRRRQRGYKSALRQLK